MWDREAEEVTARAGELRQPAAVETLSEQLAGRAVDAAWWPEYSHDHEPSPYRPAAYGQSAASGSTTPFEGSLKVEVDSQGRPVRATAGSTLHLLDWEPSRVWFAETRRGALRGLQLVVLEGGRAARSVSWRIGDDPSTSFTEPELYVYDGGLPRWALRVFGDATGWGAAGTRFTHDSGGELVRSEHVVLEDKFLATDLAAAFGQAVDELEQRGQAQELWDARLQRFEPPRPGGPPPADSLVEPLAVALVDGASAAAVALGGPPAALAVVVQLQPGRLLAAAALTEEWLDRARATRADPSRLTDLALSGGRGSVSLDVRDHLDPTKLADVRSVIQARDPTATYGDGVPWATGVALVRELAARLEDAFGRPVALLASAVGGRAAGPEHAEAGWARFDPAEPAFELVREALGGAAALELSARLGLPDAVLGDGDGDEYGDLGWPEEDEHSEPSVQLEDRGALRSLLVDRGLTESEADKVAGDAAWALELHPASAAETRIGGVPMLASGTPWPTYEGRPLTHLATVAWAEVPLVEGREDLPVDGFLAFFADLSEEAEFFEPVGPDGEENHGLVALIATEAGDAVERRPPGDAPVLEELRVRAHPRLQLRRVGFGYAERIYGIDALGEAVIERTAQQATGRAKPQLLGFPDTVQDDPRQSGQLALLHLPNRAVPSFDLLDAGDLLFFISAQDARARRWDQVTAWPSSC